MNLYKVTLTYEIMVVAEDSRDAKHIAQRHAGDETASMSDVELIVNKNQIPGEWLHALPYRDYGDKTEIKCVDLVAAMAAEEHMGL